jgi:hypothetical protein
MSIRRRTVCVLAALCAPLGTLAVTATAQAAPTAPTISSIAIYGGSNLTTDGTGTYFSNDPIDSGTGETTDSFAVTVAGDPNASSIDLYEGATHLSQTPDVNGDATFIIPSLPPSTPSSQGDGVIVSQTVAGQSSDPIVDYVFVGNIPSVDVAFANNTVPAGGTLSVGSAIPGDGVELFVDGLQQPTATADSTGVADGLAGGLTADYHTAYAQTVDGQGNASTTSPTVGFYVAPPAPTIQTPVQDPGDAPFSNENEPSITVSGVLAGATVDLYQIDPQTGQPGASLDSVTSVNGGTATVTPTTPVADGQDTFYVTQTVSEGTGSNQQMVTSDINPSLQNNKADVHVDTAAPSLMTSFMGSTTNNNEPGFLYSLSGVYSTVAKVRLIDANTGQTLGEGSAINSGEWVPTSPLPDGQYSVYAVSIDDAGNVGTAQSAPVTFTIDTVAPPAPTVTAPADGATVTTATPTITTSANEPGATICVYVDGSTINLAVPCQTADSNGDASFTLSAALAAGQHTLTATANDAAGNYSYTDTAFTVNTSTSPTGPTPTPPGTTPVAPVAPPVTTTPAPPTGSSPPVAVASATVTAHAGVVELNASRSTAAAGKTITAYSWYLGAKLLGHTEFLDYRMPPGVSRETVTLRVTDSAGATSTAQVVVSAHGHETTVALSTKTLFAYNSARLTPSAKRPAFLFGGHVPSSVHLSVKGMGGAHDRSGTTQDRRSTITYERFVVTINK